MFDFLLPACKSHAHSNFLSAVCTWALQVDKAWEYLQQSEEVDKPDVRYTVRVLRQEGGPLQRGIYLREPKDVNKSIAFSVSVKAELQEVGPLLCSLFTVNSEKL